MTSRWRSLNWRTQVIQRRLAYLRTISRRSLWMAPPRLPMNVPRAAVRKRLPYGSTRFWRGMQPRRISGLAGRAVAAFLQQRVRVGDRDDAPDRLLLIRGAPIERL